MIFANATRQKIRFQSVRGELSVEQLWDLPLSSKTGFDLDTIAKAVNKELKTVSEDSFVAVKVNAQETKLTLALDVLKHIIQVKLAEDAEAKQRVANAAERQRLIGILEKKQDQALEALTPEEIQKRLQALG